MIKEVRIMYVEFRLLKYFLAVAREENITKAANVLHITQPTLSRQLAQLEEDLNVKLFIRGKRSIVLTNEGMLKKLSTWWTRHRKNCWSRKRISTVPLPSVTVNCTL